MTPATTPPPDSFNSGDQVPAHLNIDGRWRYAASGEFPEACIVIQDNHVTEFDVGCDGTPLSLATTPQFQAFTGNIQVFFGYSDPPGDPVNGGIYTFTLRIQPNGNLSGSGILREQPAGAIKSANVVWVKQ